MNWRATFELPTFVGGAVRCGGCVVGLLVVRAVLYRTCETMFDVFDIIVSDIDIADGRIATVREYSG